MTDEAQEPSMKKNIKERSTWMRGLYMLLFFIIYGIAEFLLVAVVVFQFISMVVLRKTNDRLRDFGRSLSAFIYEILLFLTYNSEDRPYPFGSWPAQTGSLKTADQTG